MYLCVYICVFYYSGLTINVYYSIAQVLRVVPDEEKVFLTLLQEDTSVDLKLVHVP